MSTRIMGIWMGALLLLAGAAGAADEAPAPPPKVQAGADGFSISSADGSWKVRFYGYAQVDGRFGLADDAELVTDTFTLRRVRPSLQITAGKSFEATFVPDLGGSAPTIQDAYIDVKRSPALRLRAGKFKVPLAFERLQSGSATLFIERSLASGLVPNRDVGLQVLGEAGPAQYALALLNGGPDGGSIDNDTTDSKDLAARLFLRPFRKSEGGLKGLGFGVGATTGTQKGSLPTQRTTAQAVYFQYAAGTTAGGGRTRVAPQASFTAGPFGAFAEYVRNEQEVVRGAARDRVALAAWTVGAGFVLTGEKSGLGAVSPSRAFDPVKGGRGAWELVARVSGFDAEDAVFTGGFADPARSARAALAVGVGLNWYLTKNVRQALDFERTTFEGGAAGGGDRETENALLWRLQVAF